MGFDLQVTRFVLEAHRSGAAFAEAGTLGRQNLNINEDVYRAEALRFGLDASEGAIARVWSSYPYVDALMHELGASATLSVDVSDYERASFIADMNKPIPQDLAARFSLLIDGGTLEHVFDLPQAARNVGKMLKVGGHFLSINGANNFMGHGFYQFSPELFFRIFSPDNGFEVESMLLTEANDDAVWYDVADPATVGHRVQLINNAPVYLMMRARKIADVPMFARTPQQSDYRDLAWQVPSDAPGDRRFLNRPLGQRFIEKFFPRFARLASRRLYQATRRHFAAPGLTKVREF
jgi:SAM-dependent methyltransferase